MRIILALLVLVFSSLIIEAIRFPILRLLEGYWPWLFNYLSQFIVSVRRRSFQRKFDELWRLKALEQKTLGSDPPIEPMKSQRLMELETWVHWNPAGPDRLLPTALENILRSRESDPERNYGLDAVVCWPRLSHLFPENVRGDLDEARASLYRLIALCFWGLLFMLWAFLTPWAVAIGLLWMILAYDMSLQLAMSYGDLLESAFDLHRLSLYDAMGWPRPKNTKEEKALGCQLTEFLWRGTLRKPIIYQSTQD